MATRRDRGVESCDRCAELDRRSGLWHRHRNGQSAATVFPVQVEREEVEAMPGHVLDVIAMVESRIYG